MARVVRERRGLHLAVCRPLDVALHVLADIGARLVLDVREHLTVRGHVPRDRATIELLDQRRTRALRQRGLARARLVLLAAERACADHASETHEIASQADRRECMRVPPATRERSDSSRISVSSAVGVQSSPRLRVRRRAVATARSVPRRSASRSTVSITNASRPSLCQFRERRVVKRRSVGGDVQGQLRAGERR